MNFLDQETVRVTKLSSLDLMENASNAVVEEIHHILIDLEPALVVCGPGNNGGDGAAISRILADSEREVFCLLKGKVENLSGDAKINFDRLIETNVTLLEVDTREEIDQALAEIEKVSSDTVSLVVDALFGTGLKRPLEGEFAYLVDRINRLAEQSFAHVVSVDLPSGIDADKSELIGPFIEASSTVTFAAPKFANVFAPAAFKGGGLSVVDIGTDPTVLNEIDTDIMLGDESDIETWLSKTSYSLGSFKKTKGRLHAVTGSSKYPGAAILSAEAALKTGIGIMTMNVPDVESVRNRLSPEIMVSAAGVETFGTDSVDKVLQDSEVSDAVLLGCGIDRGVGVTQFVREVVKRFEVPIIIDADGLFALSPFEIEKPDLILTPHEGEFVRLLGRPIQNRIEDLREFAKKHDVICLLKGEVNLVANGQGQVAVVPTYMPALGKAGNGDVLAGIVAGFVAQASAKSAELFETVVAATYFAGLAGDIAKERYGVRSMNASDVIECIPSAFKSVETNV